MYCKIIVEPETVAKCMVTCTEPETVVEFMVWVVTKPETVVKFMVESWSSLKLSYTSWSKSSQSLRRSYNVR